MTEIKNREWRKNAYLFLIGQGLTMFDAIMAQWLTKE
jgi:hypothetical protein